MRDTIVCIPTYNEVDNIRPLVTELFSRYPDISVLVVDDQSPDGTAQSVRELQSSYPNLHLVERDPPRGFAASYKTAFEYALNRRFDWILQMDADLSHKPHYIADLLRARENADVVVGSRYVAGGGVKNWPLRRRLLSAGGNVYVKLWLKTRLKDMTGGFNLWHRDLLSSLPLNELTSDGYSFIIELKYQASRMGARIVEVPIIFEDRRAQESKMSASIFREAVTTVPLLRLRSIGRRPNALVTSVKPPAISRESGKRLHAVGEK